LPLKRANLDKDLKEKKVNMSQTRMPALRIGDLEIRIPIIQGGMAIGISLSGLASAVAEAGGAGVIGTAGIGMMEPDYNTDFKKANQHALRKEIRKAKKNTTGVIGVNIMVVLSDFRDMVRVTVEEKVDMVLLGAGLPLKDLNILIPTHLGEVKPKVIPIVSSSRAAKIIFQYWKKNYNYIPDAVVLEGPMAGGHLGFKKDQINNPEYSLDKLLPETISALKPFEKEFKKNIPVIVAGGIYTGTDIFHYLQMGAQGVQMATRFVATEECDASEKFKQAYIDCNKNDLVIIDSPVGLPGRAIKNQFLQEVFEGNKKPFRCYWKCLKTCDFKSAPYCIASALTHAQRGELGNGFAFAGANAYRIKEIITVKKLIAILMKEYNTQAE
jgi:NAD(P)H-dependent flavin oxidoreductase YrpB (nitropropane dioxygenase family)